MTPSPRWSSRDLADLQTLRDAINDNILDLKFDMTRYRVPSYFDGCCIGGHAVALWGGSNLNNRLSLILGPDDYHRLVYPTNLWGWGISRAEAVRLLDHLITTGRVDWSALRDPTPITED